MGRRGKRDEPGPSGFLVVDKPPGWTSHDVVDAARRWLGARRIGHLGTLDPQATGVLPLAVREATKLIPFLEPGVKSYRARIVLGSATDTYDLEGTVTSRHEGPLPEPARIEAELATFVGDVEQVPPMYSSVKRHGVPLHKLARQGKEVEREARRVRIDAVRVLAIEGSAVEIEVDCGPGTYVRVLAHDLGQRLGCGAHLGALVRLRNDPFVIEQAAPVEELEALAEAGKLEERLVPPEQALGLPRVELDRAQVARIGHGGEVREASLARSRPGGRYAGIAPSGELVAILELHPAGMLRPIRVLRTVAAG